MSNWNEEEVKVDYCAGILTLRKIVEKHGIAKSTLIDLANRRGWVRKKSLTKSATKNPTKPTKKADQKKSGRTDGREQVISAGLGITKNSGRGSSSETKRKNRSGNPNPKNQFSIRNTASLKHGGYARRMLFSDSIVEDAQALSLEDELFLLRARNLYTAENIGRWRTQLDDYGGENRDLQDKISAAENAMMRNTTRIESIEGTLASIRKIHADADYREVATEKLLRESDRERNELELEGLRLRNEKLRTENENLKKSASDNDNELPQPVAININVVDAKVRNDDSADT